MVVPNILGICVWSPPLDNLSNSVRGVEFCKELVKHFKSHNYDSVKSDNKKIDPRLRKMESEATTISNALFCAQNGDVSALKRIIGISLRLEDAVDYDGRTALHVAAAEGQFEVAQFLVGATSEENLNCITRRDRFGFTPLDDANRFGHEKIANYLKNLYTKLNLANNEAIKEESPIVADDSNENEENKGKVEETNEA